MLAILGLAARRDANAVSDRQFHLHRTVKLEAIRQLCRNGFPFLHTKTETLLESFGILLELHHVARFVLCRISLLGIGQADGHPRSHSPLVFQLASRLHAVTYGSSYQRAFRVRRRHDQHRFGLAVFIFLRHGGQVGQGYLLVTSAVGCLPDPTEFVELLECLFGQALAQCPCRLLIVPLLPQNVSNLCHRQSRLFFQQFQRFSRRHAAMLPAVADQEHTCVQFLGQAN